MAKRLMKKDVVDQVSRGLPHAPREGQNPLRLQVKAKNLSWPQSAQLMRRNPRASAWPELPRVKDAGVPGVAIGG